MELVANPAIETFHPTLTAEDEALKKEVLDATGAEIAPGDMPPQDLATHYLTDHKAYKREFFPNTVRQDSPDFHDDIDTQLWSGKRFNGFKIFRDGAKTTTLRLFTSKRIAYGVSRTIVFVGNSADSSIRSIDWLKKQVERNKKWANFYGLVPGKKWANDEIEIVNTLLGISITIIGVGIRGSTRGINVDDYRPDLIVVDDADDEETTNTPEQCRKYVKTFFGSIVRSLTPATENPNAMIAVLQTPLAAGDIISTCASDEQWHVMDISCFDAKGQSRWPARYPTQTLLADKASMIAKRLLSVWLREMEVTIASEEGNAFAPDWLKFYDVLPSAFDMMCIAIDPASSDSDQADDNAIVLWGKANGHYYLIAVGAETGQTHIETSELLFTIFLPLAKRLNRNLNPIVAIETIGYQKNLKAQIDADQRKYNKFFAIKAVGDKRAKYDRILQSFKGNGYAGLILCDKQHTKFIEQFTTYSRTIKHDDVIDASSMAIAELDPEGTEFKAVATGGVKRTMDPGPRLTNNGRRMFPTVGRSRQYEH